MSFLLFRAWRIFILIQLCFILEWTGAFFEKQGWLSENFLLVGNGSTELVAQSVDSSSNKKIPEPYEPDEFPIFLQDLRRFEVILLGSVPITLLLGALVYDIIYSISEPDITSFSSATSNDALFQKIGISISISGLLAILDMAIHLTNRKRKRQERERTLRNSEFIRGADSAESRAGSEKFGRTQGKPSAPEITTQ